MQLFDSHAHYFDARFASEECPDGVGALLSRLFGESGLVGAVNVSVDLPSAQRALEQAKSYPAMYVAAGFHPTDAMQYDDIDRELSALRTFILANREKVVALGEIGLDYHYPDTDKERQSRWFEAQLALAEELDIPVVIHDRDAHGDCFDAVRAHPRVHGVFHSYSGSAEMALDLIRRGWYISFSGTVTFKNAARVAAVCAALPHSRVMVETDAPYLAPHPHRGKLNHSGYLTYTVSRVAELWGISPEDAARITTENARAFYGIKEV